MSRVQCPKCLFVNPEGQEQCAKCRTPLPRVRIQSQPQQSAPAPRANGIQLTRGQVVARRYTVTNMIGRGGMGCIFRVFDNVLGEDVALKTLLPQYVQDKVVVERFFNEARIARKLAHPNIVRVHDIGSAENFVYISMEFVQGHSLRSILEKLPQGQRLPLLETLRIMDELCAALEYAHNYTIHRDIKPENVMLDESGRVKLMDFGISKLMANNQLTGASMVMGTPFYMSPEQLRNSRDVDARADIFSVGVMFYEILTGNMPTGVPRPASQLEDGIPPALDAIVARCVDPNPDRRFSNAAELRAAIREVRDQLTGESVQRRGAGTTHRSLPMRKILGVGVLVVLLLLAAVGWHGLEQRRHRLVEEGVAGVASAQETPAPQEDLPALLGYLESLAKRTPPGGSPLASAFEEGKKRLEIAKAGAANDPGAQRSAEEALQFLAAPFVATPGMVFVGPGEVRSAGAGGYEPAFLIDSREVTVSEYGSFVQANQWRVPAGFAQFAQQNPRVAMCSVAYFDAEAYAAAQGKLLPTRTQWERAASAEGAAFPWGNEWKEKAANINSGKLEVPGSFEDDVSWAGCFDMEGNVAELTRVPPDFAAADILPFGTEVEYKGGDYALQKPLPLGETRRMAYEAGSPTVGFRCVMELPRTLAAARALLDN